MVNIKKYINRNIIKFLLKYIGYCFLDFLLFLLILFKKRKNKNKFKIITVADSNFFAALTNLLDSIKFYEPSLDVVIYDIGLEEEDKKYLNKKYNYKLKNFQFKKYPSFINSYDSDGKLGSYAWKALIIQDEYFNDNKNIIYLDAGCELRKSLRLLKFVLLRNGLFSPSSSDDVKRWTHPTTLNRMKVSPKLLSKRNFSAASIGLVTNNDTIANIVSKWAKFSQDKDTISPKGSSRLNHRQDQAILNILIHQNLNSFMIFRTQKIFGILTHSNKDVGLFK